MKIVDAIKKRKSIRTYDGRRLSEAHKASVMKFIKELKPEQKDVRFVFVDTDDEALSEIKGLASYGTLKGVNTVLACIQKNGTSMFDYGFLIERIILFAEQLDIGTCWMGGTFSRASFLKAIPMEADETLPVIISMGYATEKENRKSAMLRYMIKADKRKPFNTLFFDSRIDIPLSAERAGWAYEVLEMVRIGPSASNKQPWRIIMNPQGGFDFYLSRTKGYATAIGFDVQMIDMGIAACHFALTAEENGVHGIFVRQAPPEIPNGLDYIVTFQKNGK